jgi:hypothetical protein
MWRASICVGVIFCLFVVQSVSMAASFGPETVKDQVEQLGPGARVKIKLTDGRRASGVIAAFRDGGFTLAPKNGGASRQIAYSDVRQLKLSSRRYTAHQEVDPQAARRVVEALGVGKHIMVNPTGAHAIHGNIQTIEADHFTVLPDRSTVPVTIAYNDIHHVEKNLTVGGTIVLVVLIVAALVVITTVAATH